MTGKRAETQTAACCGGEAVRLGHKVRDPLCGMSVDANSPYRLAGNGSLRFCSESCKDDYARAMAGESEAGVSFACEMHPEGRLDWPGECSVCGMKLMPVRTAMAGDASSPSGTGMFQRLRLALRL